jgi:tRNA 5-methylaminomethyl-2-thiouridine biosynthesis bifunctional protein
MKVAIIGGGLAGCAAAYVLRRAGITPVIYEAGESLATGASGNDLGLYNLRLAAEMSPQAQYYAGGFQAALDIFPSLEGIDWNPCGALHLITDEKKQIRFTKMVESWNWPGEELRLCSATEASDIAGVEIDHDALFLARSGYVSPRKLCAAYVDGVEVKLNTKVESLEEIEANVIILACAAAVNDFAPELPLQKIRGQVSYVRSSGALASLKTCLCYGGYAAPVHEGVHMVGSTFQRWLDHTDILSEDDADNLAKLGEAIPSLAGEYDVAGHRAAIRTASRDHFPIVKELSSGLYVSTAHGSHGIVSSLKAAHIILESIEKRIRHS